MVNLLNKLLICLKTKIERNFLGQVFDMHPDRFTLSDMFAMELHKSQEIAETIVNNAIKEMQIEKGVKDIKETWANVFFTVSKHYKGNEDRGYILLPVDEILTQLDNDSMSLQSMAGSP